MERNTAARPSNLYRWHTVLLVDDDPNTLSALQRLLQREPYDVLTTDRPALVLDWMERRDVSLVVADRRMPEMDGDRFLEEVWKRSPTTVGVILTAFPEIPRAERAGTRGPRCLIGKPWSDEMLKRTILKLLWERERALEESARPRVGGITP